MGNFNLLGAAFGTVEWCESLFITSVDKAQAVLTAIGKYEDSHGALAWLRLCSCSSWAKVSCSCWTVPPCLQSDTCSGQTGTSGKLSSPQVFGTPTEGSPAWTSLQAESGHAVRSSTPRPHIASVFQCEELRSLIWPGLDASDWDVC